MTPSSYQGSDDDRENLTSATDTRARRAEGASADTGRSENEHTTTGGAAANDTFAERFAGRSARFSEDARPGHSDNRRQQPAGEREERPSRVTRVAPFARWAEAVTATTDNTESRTKRARKRAGRAKRRGAATAVSGVTMPGKRAEAPGTMEAARGSAVPVTGGGAEHDPSAKTVCHATEPSGLGYRVARREERFGTDDAERERGGGMTSFEFDMAGPDGGGTRQREPASDCKVASYPGDESLRRSYLGDEGDSNKKFQIGAGERRAVPAGRRGTASRQRR